MEGTKHVVEVAEVGTTHEQYTARAVGLWCSSSWVTEPTRYSAKPRFLRPTTIRSACRLRARVNNPFCGCLGKGQACRHMLCIRPHPRRQHTLVCNRLQSHSHMLHNAPSRVYSMKVSRSWRDWRSRVTCQGIVWKDFGQEWDTAGSQKRFKLLHNEALRLLNLHISLSSVLFESSVAQAGS